MLGNAASSLIGGVSSFTAGASSRYMGSGVTPSASAGPVFERDMDRMYHGKIRPLLDAVDTLRGVLRDEAGIAVPSIVVVGDQSSGTRHTPRTASAS